MSTKDKSKTFASLPTPLTPAERHTVFNLPLKNIYQQYISSTFMYKKHISLPCNKNIYTIKNICPFITYIKNIYPTHISRTYAGQEHIKNIYQEYISIIITYIQKDIKKNISTSNKNPGFLDPRTTYTSVPRDSFLHPRISVRHRLSS